MLSVRGVCKEYRAGRSGFLVRKSSVLRAVDDVSFSVGRGEVLGLAGESGCGKSTLARLLVALEAPTRGDVVFQGTVLGRLSAARLRAVRRQIQIVLQDPYLALSPRMTVGEIVGEGLEIHQGLCPKNMRKQRVGDLLRSVGLSPSVASRYPHQFSGGQRQRVAIARAIAVQPDVLVCDEPISALDVSARAQIIALLGQLREQFNLATVFIAHDLAAMRYLCDRVAVMYLGRVVEFGTRSEIFSGPLHPYTQALMSAAPIPDPSLRHRPGRIVLVGDVPSPLNPPSGCAFRTRCWRAQAICSEVVPLLEHRGGSGQRVACHFPERRVVGHMGTDSGGSVGA